MKRIIVILVFLISTLSCSDFLDVNENPNQLIEVPSGELLLKGTLLANAQVQKGHLMRAAGYYSGQLIGLQLVQEQIYRYTYTAAESNPTWEVLYNGILAQNKDIRRLSPNNLALQGIVDINEAMAIGTATTIWGDIPYSQAVPDNPTLESRLPTFDGQLEVYQAVQDLLDRGINSLQNSTTVVTDEDIYAGGDKTVWIEAANTLKARNYLLTRDYDRALQYAQLGISSDQNTLAYVPIGAVDGNSNILANFVRSTRAGDMTGRDAYYQQLLDPANENSRNHAKTDETARRQYSFVSGNSVQAGGIDDPAAPMPLVSYAENTLIWAECLVRSGDMEGGLTKLNELREFLNSGQAFNLISDTLTYRYEPFEMSDFAAGGIENQDGIQPDRALLREIIEERYVSGFLSYIPFNDVRRLRNESDIRVPFPLNENSVNATINPQRFLYPQTEIDRNPNVPSPLPGLFEPTPVNQ